jgi:hypothetical protein
MYTAVLMDSKDLDKLNLNLKKRFFDFANHNHVYHFHIWKGQFSLREMRSAATYSEIADRFEVAISCWAAALQNSHQYLRRPCRPPSIGLGDLSTICDSRRRDPKRVLLHFSVRFLEKLRGFCFSLLPTAVVHNSCADLLMPQHLLNYREAMAVVFRTRLWSTRA